MFVIKLLRMGMKEPRQIDELFLSVDYAQAGGEEGEAYSDEFIDLVVRAKESMRGAREYLQQIKGALKRMKVPMEVYSLKFEKLHGEIKDVEYANDVIELEIKNKDQAYDLMYDLIDRMAVQEEDLAALQEPHIEDAEGIASVGKALAKISDLRGIADPELRKIRAVKEKFARAEKAEASLEKELLRVLDKIFRRLGRASSSDVDIYKEFHGPLKVYGKMAEWLKERGHSSYTEVLMAYVQIAEKLYVNCFNRNVTPLLSLFKKKLKAQLQSESPGASHDISARNIEGQIHTSFVSVLDVYRSLVAGELCFLRNHVTFDEDKQLEELTGSLMKGIFKQLPQQMAGFVEQLYQLKNQKVPVLNLLAILNNSNIIDGSAPSESRLSESEGPPEGSGNEEGEDSNDEGGEEDKRLVANMLEEMKAQVRERLVQLKREYVGSTLKKISGEYVKKGTVDLDENYFMIVDRCLLRDVSTEVIKAHLHGVGRLREDDEKIFITIKRAGIVGVLHAHFLQNKKKFDEWMEGELNKLMDAIAKEFEANALAHIFGKGEKPTSVARRVKEVYKLVLGIDGPFGFRVSILFKDLVLSKVNFHQKNEIAQIFVKTARP